MKPTLILSLALVLSVFILRPALVRAEERIWVDGSINGQPVRLAIDTGASGPVLFKKSAERLGLKFTPPSDATAPNEVTVGITEYCEFNLSGDIHKMYFHVFELPDFLYARDKMDGVLGWGALGSDIFLIDASQGMMTALAVLPEEVKTWQQFRVQTNMDVLILEIPGEGPTNTIFIDTGRNAGIGLAPDDWPAWKNKHRTQQLTLRAAYMPAAGVYVAEEAWADQISFGPLLLTDVPISEAHATAVHFPSCKAVFGMAALKRMDLVVDGINGIAYVNPKRSPATPYDHNRLGAVFVPADAETDDDLIAHVAVGSPAQKAGVRNGDVLLKVGDRDMTNWRTNHAKQAFWEQSPGTEHRLTLRREQQTNEVTVKLENILGPGSALADAGNPSPVSALKQLQNLARQVLEAQIESQRKMLRQAVSARAETYEFTMEARRAFTEMVETPEFLSVLEKNGGDRSNPRLVRQLAFEHLDRSTHLRPTLVAWIKLSFSSDSSWESAHSLYRKVAAERPKDFLPKVVTLVRGVQTQAEADEWFTLFKEAYASATQPKERALCVAILPSHAAGLAGMSDSESQLQKLSAWLADVETTETAERLPMLDELGFIKFWVAFAQKDYPAAAEWAKDSRVRALRPLMFILAGKPDEARQSLGDLQNDPALTQQERDTLSSVSKMLDEMKAATTP